MAEANIIDRAFDVFSKIQQRAGLSVDELSFVGGFQAYHGIITGRVNIGLPADTSVLSVIESVQRQLELYREDVMRKMSEQREQGA